MDSILEDRLMKIHERILKLQKVEARCGEMEAHEKVLFAELYLKQIGEKQNVDTKKSLVYASKEWRDFAKGLAIQQSERNKERRLYELTLKAFDAEYLTFKVDNSAIARQK